MIEFEHPKPFNSSLSIAPLIDIIFLLLLFFLLTSVLFSREFHWISRKRKWMPELRVKYRQIMWVKGSRRMFEII